MMWQGIQAIMDDEATLPSCENSTAFLNEHLFEENHSLMSRCSVWTQLRRGESSALNVRKAVSPDNIPGWMLRECADQLTGVLTDIFNISLHQAVAPCFKTSPSAKKASKHMA